MEKNNKQLAPQKDDDEYIYSCTDDVVSGTECTGLIPTPPENEQQAESYTELYTIPKPAGRKADSTQKAKKPQENA